MAIKRLRVSNFKSFKNLEVELGRFNVLIGANASGKSNFLQIFKFLRDIANHGLDNAISIQGGVEYLRNINLASSKNLLMNIVYDPNYGFLIEHNKKLIAVKVKELICRFSIRFAKKGSGFEIVEDKLIQRCECSRLERRARKKRQEDKLGAGEIALSMVDGKVKVNLSLPQGVPLKPDDIVPALMHERKPPTKTLLLETSGMLGPPRQRIFGNIPIYDFEPRLGKKSVPIVGKAELEEDGGNLALVLKNVLENREKKRKFSNLIKDLLPFVKDVNTEKFADKSLFFKLRETYFPKQYLPGSSISDGTINMAELIIALYFEEKQVTIIEEPERNIHPYLISRVIEMMKDASQKKQIIVTTHNPEIVKYAGLENILLVSRDKEGFSTITKPADKKEVKTFLKNEIGIEELYVQNLLGV